MRLAGVIACALALSAGAAQKWDSRVWPAYQHYRGVVATQELWGNTVTFLVTNWSSLTEYTVKTNSRLVNIIDAPITNSPMESVVDFRVWKPVETCEWAEVTNEFGTFFDWVCETNLEYLVERRTQTSYRVSTNLLLDVPDLRAYQMRQAILARLGEIVVWTNRDVDLHYAITNFTHYAAETNDASVDNVTNSLSGLSLDEFSAGPNFSRRYANDYYRWERANLGKCWAAAAWLSQFYFCHVGNDPGTWTLGIGDAWRHSSHRTPTAAQAQSNEIPRHFFNNASVLVTNRPAKYMTNIVGVLYSRGHPTMSGGDSSQSVGDWVNETMAWGDVAASGSYRQWLGEMFWLAGWAIPSIEVYSDTNLLTNAIAPWRGLNELHTNQITWNTAQLLVDSMSIYGKVPVAEIFTECGPLWTPTKWGIGINTNTRLMRSQSERVYVPMDTWLAGEVEHLSPEEPYGTLTETGLAITGYGELPTSDSLVFTSGRASMVTNLNSVFVGQQYDTAAAGQVGAWYTLIGPWTSNRLNHVEIIMDSVIRAPLQGGTNFVGYTTNTIGTYSGWVKFHNCRIKDAWIQREEEGDTRFLSMWHTREKVQWTVRLGAIYTNDADGTPYWKPDSDGGVASIVVELDFKDSFKSRANDPDALYQWPQGLWYIKDW